MLDCISKLLFIFQYVAELLPARKLKSAVT
jgi:hypothetical protein